MNSGVRLIAFDLDGTVLNEALEMSERTSSALRLEHERGAVTVVSTGRSLYTLPSWLRELIWIDYIIAANGAVTINAATGRLLRYCPMSASVAAEAVWTAGEFSSSIDAMMSDCVLCAQTCAELLKYAGIDGRYTDMDGKTQALIGSGVVKLNELPRRILEKLIATCNDTKGRDTLIARFRDSKTITAVSASDVAVELTARSVTKGAALNFLRKKLCIEKRYAIAFGDSGNDLPMRQAVGRFIAMGNAPEEVRACADAVTLSIQSDGVAHFLEEQEWR